MPGWVRTRSFAVVGGPSGMLLIHEWSDAEASASDEFERELASEWRTQLLKNMSNLERCILTLHEVLS